VPASGVARSTFARGPAATIRHADRAWRDKVRARNGRLIRDHAAHLIHVVLRLFFVMPGLDPGIHQSSQNAFSRWIAGSSPATTN
jgi:hypothetical protein